METRKTLTIILFSFLLALTASAPAAPVFSLDTGFYNSDEVKELTLTSSDKIYYTLDSSDPTKSETAKEYSEPIKMYDRSPEENVYSKCKHEENSPFSITLKAQFTPGKDPFDKVTIVRAAAKGSDGSFSPVVTKTFLVMDSTKLAFYKGIPTVSLVTDPDNLFSKDKGIYVCGQQYLDWKSSPNYNGGKNEYDTDNVANFFSKGKEWEREAYITYFIDGKVEWAQTLGIRIKGASTRNHKDKSFNIYARSSYGEGKLNYALFDDNKNFVNGKVVDSYDSFSIRAFEWIERLREKVVQAPQNDIGDMGSYDSKKVMFFIDGEFWGMYELSERCSEHFIESKYSIPNESVSIIKNDEVESGPDSELDALHELGKFCENNDMSKSENYEKVTEKIDIDSLIKHYGLGVYIINNDWPDKNYFMWRNNGAAINGNPYSDGKWRFGAFDYDWSSGLSFGGSGGNAYAQDYFQKVDSSRSKFPTNIFIGLLKNSDFKKRFEELFTELAQKTFSTDKMQKILGELEDKYMKYLVLGSWRWVSNPTKNWDAFSQEQTAYFKKEIGVMKEFFAHRAEYVIDDMKNYLSRY